MVNYILSRSTKADAILSVWAVGLRTLEDGQQVEFEIEENTNNGKQSAVNLKIRH